MITNTQIGGIVILPNQRDIFKKGCVELVILSLLQNSDMYGYDLVDKINTNGNNIFSVKEGSMYPTLYRLEEKGYITSYKKQVGKRQVRIYYHVEDLGKEYYAALKNAYFEIYDAVCNILAFSEEDKNG